MHARWSELRLVTDQRLGRGRHASDCAARLRPPVARLRLPGRRRWALTRRGRRVTAAVAALTALFTALALLLRKGPGTALDLAITRRIQRIEHPAFHLSMHVVGAFGFHPLSWAVPLCTVVGLRRAGLRREARFVALGALGGLLAALCKLAVARPRPHQSLVRVAWHLPDYSFPSGHAALYVSYFGFLAFLSYVLLQRSPLRSLALVTLTLLMVLVAPARIFVGHHWASDVVGGYALGAAYLLVLIERYRDSSRLHLPTHERRGTPSP